MSKRDRKSQVFQALAGLRRAGRRNPEETDLTAARILLEQDLGPTVSQRLAADILGVSHTALRRWIERGDVPVVYSEAGRMQIPVGVLLDLYEEVEAARAAGRGHLLEPLVLAAQRRADHLAVGELSDLKASDGKQLRPQALGLAYHRALAERLTVQMISDALQLLAVWEHQDRIDPVYATRWRELLSQPIDDVRRQIGADTPHMTDLRQNSPFAGMLSERERRAVLSALAPVP